MVRVGFHLHNDGQETVDCSRIIYGNPGIGGAEYAIIAIAYMLSVDKNDIEVTVLSFKTIPIILVILRKTIIFAHSDA